MTLKLRKSNISLPIILRVSLLVEVKDPGPGPFKPHFYRILTDAEGGPDLAQGKLILILHQQQGFLLGVYQVEYGQHILKSGPRQIFL